MTQVAEDFRAIYTAFTQANFNSYDYDTIKDALINYIRQNYPENFNSWIKSTEFVMLLEMIAFLAHSLAFRIDLAGRENFLMTAERRESILRIVDFLGYVPSRAVPAQGILKLTSIRSTQNIYDTNGGNLKDIDVLFEDNYQNFLLVLNEILNGNNKFGRPTDSTTIGNVKTDVYQTNTLSEREVVHNFEALVNNISAPFEIYSVNIDKKTNTIQEVMPNPFSSFDMLYLNDNQGVFSNNTGFFVGFKQGRLAYTDVSIDEAIPNLVVDVNSSNVNNIDVHVQEIDENGEILEEWIKVDSTFGANTVFNLIQSNQRKLYSVKTLDDDNISVQFGDGIFSDIPRGIIRIWYRTSLNQSYVLNPDDVGAITFGFDYNGADGNIYNVSFDAELTESINNASARESVSSIRNNAGRVFSTQDRMISGDDYSIYPLTASENIKKIKAVNRTYAGHSRFIRHNDPTAQYQSVDMIGSDGYLYTEPQVFSNTVALPTTLTNNQIFEKFISPLISNPEIVNLFYDKYSPIPVDFSMGFEWQQITRSFRGSTGYFTTQGRIERVGNTSTSVTRNIKPNSIIEFIEAPYNVGSIESIEVIEGGSGYPDNARIEFIGTGSGASGTITVDSNGKITDINITKGSGYDNPVQVRVISSTGEGAIIKAVASSAKRTWARVIDIYEDGLGVRNSEGRTTGISPRGQGAILLNKTIPNSARISQIFPAYSNKFTEIEKQEVLMQLANKNTFGIRYDTDEGWKIITNPPLSNNNPMFFSHDNNQSWILRVDYSTTQWQILSRRIRYIFGSEDDIRFYNQNNRKKLDVETNKAESDQIIISRINTAANGSPVALNQDYSLFIYKYFAKPNGMTDNRFVSVSIADEDNDNYPDNPLVFKNIVGGVDRLPVAGQNDKANFRTPIESGIDRTGRKNLTFTWKRISESTYRIDPSISNIHDIFVLTQTYDTEFRNWLTTDRNLINRPNTPSEIELERQFRDITQKKALSDTIIYRAGSYRILFGEMADIDMQGVFKVVPVIGTALTDTEIKTRILTAINSFFNIDRWNFGDTFYFTELVSWVHQQLPGIIHSFVVTPKQTSLEFGRLFQITLNSNELPIPDVTLRDIEITTTVDVI